MDETSPNLDLPYLQAAQAQKHVTHNAALERLDLIVQLSLQSFAETTPPAAPEEGQVWAIGSGAVNDWAGHDGELAGWSNGGWVFIIPQPGWRAALAGELRVFDGTGWTGQGLPALQNLPGVGIGTSYDGTNRLAVAAEATLFNHDGAGHQLKVNKNAAGQTASLLFQTAFSGRVEIGTLGTDNFAVKVSADGSSWTDALVVAAATGVMTGAAVTQSATDATAGRLTKVGDFGIGGLGPVLGNASVTDNTIAPGLYAYSTSSGSSGGPAGVSFGGMLHMRRASGGGEAQIFTADQSGRIYTRSRVTASWSDWREIYHQGSILGTVSQTGGVPTGALIERGSNANGAFVRFADGTQICTISELTTSASTDTTWTFPAAFFYPAPPNRPILSGNVGTTLANAWRVIFGGLASGSSININAVNTSGARVVANANLIAIGRWY